MIDNVRKTVHDFLEKDNRGWISPERFNRYAYLAQLEVFEDYFFQYNRWLNLQNNRQSNTGYSDIPKNIREKLDMFQKEATLTYVDPIFQPPADSYRILDVYANDERVDEVSQRRIRLLNKSNHTAPSASYPVHVRLENDIKVYPLTIVTNVVANYIRIPATPKWTYTVVNGDPLFNPSSVSYQDFEIHPSDETNLIIKILEYSGVTVREIEIVQYAGQKDNQKLTKENNA